MRFGHATAAMMILLFVFPSAVYACSFPVAYVESVSIPNAGVTLEPSEHISRLTVTGIDSPEVFFNGNDMAQAHMGNDEWLVLAEEGTLEVRSDGVAVYRATIAVRYTGGSNYYLNALGLVGMVVSVIALVASFLPFVRSRMSKKSAKVVRILMVVLFLISLVVMYSFGYSGFC